MYPVSDKAPRIVLGATTIAIDALLYQGAISSYIGAIFIDKGDGKGFSDFRQAFTLGDPAQLPDFIKAQGGIVNFGTWFMQHINALLVANFPPQAQAGQPAPAPVVSGEPTTPDQAVAAVASLIYSHGLSMVNGQVTFH